MNSKLHGKKEELSKIRVEINDLAKKIGQMYRAPHDSSYSSTRLDGMEKQIEKLREKEAKCLEDITEVKNSPEYIKEMDLQQKNLGAKRAKLRVDLDEIKKKILPMRYELSKKILNGGDPLILISELHDLEDRQLLITKALEAINKASSDLTRMNN
jgi:hypothetical protein